MKEGERNEKIKESGQERRNVRGVSEVTKRTKDKKERKMCKCGVKYCKSSRKSANAFSMHKILLARQKEWKAIINR